MPGDINESISEVTSSIETLNNVFEEKLMMLQQEGIDEEELSELQKGILAMKDAGRIYLTWADHFISKLNEAEGLDSMID